METLLHIDGRWCAGSAGATIPVVNPATESVVGTVAFATRADLDLALDAAKNGFRRWRAISPYERGKIMRKAASLLRERAGDVAALLTLEQGKPLAEAAIEINSAADVIDWFAEEGRRTYGRAIPARSESVYQLSLREPIGPVAAFTPWNFPVSQSARKLAAALAAGCSIILKAAEETPASPAHLVQAFVDAGVPPGVIGLVYGSPAEISGYLIPHPAIRKVSFTGSTAIGKHLAALAGGHMKPVTMELGGHAPAVVFNDADIGSAVDVLTRAKYRNAGQTCVSPTRFLVQEGVLKRFVDQVVDASRAIRVGDGSEAQTTMGPLANVRRLHAMEELVADAERNGAVIAAGGKRIGNNGFFFEPTVLINAPRDSKAMNEEPFGPLSLVVPFKDIDDAILEANRLPYGLATYAFTASAERALSIVRRVESGMVTVNHNGISLPETPFGGVKDSGFGSEGGAEGIDAYLSTKFASIT